MINVTVPRTYDKALMVPASRFEGGRCGSAITGAEGTPGLAVWQPLTKLMARSLVPDMAAVAIAAQSTHVALLGRRFYAIMDSSVSECGAGSCHADCEGLFGRNSRDQRNCAMVTEDVTGNNTKTMKDSST